MFIPPQNMQEQLRQAAEQGSAVQLKSSHLLIQEELVTSIFGDNQNVYVVYYPDRRSLLLAPTSDELFKKLHKAGQQMLKNRNLSGDKTVALHAILIDHEIDTSDRNLEYEWQEGLGILNVKL